MLSDFYGIDAVNIFMAQNPSANIMILSGLNNIELSQNALAG